MSPVGRWLIPAAASLPSEAKSPGRSRDTDEVPPEAPKTACRHSPTQKHED